MARKLTKEEFIKKARVKHGNKYDYSKVEYINTYTKVCIICPKHGEFWQTPSNHIRKTGCPICSKSITGNKKRRLTKEQFLEKAHKVHGDKYDYSKVNYINNVTKVTIICPEHGEFDQMPCNHFQGNGCPTCALEERKKKYTWTTEEFIEKAREVHGDKYDYSETVYNGSVNKVDIICPIHGKFSVMAENHLFGHGCHKCVMEKKHEEAVNRNALKKKQIESVKKEKKLNDFIEKARKVHGNKYDYSKVNYVNSYTEVCVICPIHGEFWIKPSYHLHGTGCRTCDSERKRKLKTMTTEVFIKRAKEIHGDKYIYDKVDMDNRNENGRVCIICPTHGEFWQKPVAHLQGYGCRECSIESNANRQRYDTNKFIKMSKEVHGDKYDYSKVKYVSSEDKVCVICPEHGEFMIRPHSHLSGCGCPKCSIKKRADLRRYSTEEFIEKAREVHGDKYDYKYVDYKGNKDKVCIYCNKKDKYTGKPHGKFWMSPNAHLRGNGCPSCSGNARMTTEKFIERANIVHNNKYIYTDTKYINNHGKVKVICPEHGPFYVDASNHLQGNGCPKCAFKESKPEVEIANFVKGIVGEDKVITRTRKVVKGLELDIYIPSMNIAIEYDGMIWHSEKFGKGPKYHLNKTEKCKKKGIRLIHIFEDEYLDKKEIVLAYLSHILGNDKGKKVIGGRNCVIKLIKNNEALDFLERYHIQGFVPSTCYIGAFSDNEIVAVMTLKNEGKGVWNLTRYAGKFEYRLPGIASKMLSFFKQNNEYSIIKTFLDRRWNIEGNTMYEKLGFEIDKIERPDYSYTNSHGRFHKFGFRKQIMHKKYGFPLSMTEHEMAMKAHFFRIWNCGLVRYVMKNNVAI